MINQKNDKKAWWDGHYIGDKVLFSAVTFAKRMIDEGTSVNEAIGKSSNYYQIPFSAIALEIMVDEYIKRKALKSVNKIL